MSTPSPKSEFIKSFHIKSATLFLLLLISTDLVFLVIHLIKISSPYLKSSLFSIKKDLSYAEFFQYIKWFWIVILLVYLSVAKRSWHLCSWGVFFIYILIDDSLRLHENFGREISSNLSISSLPFGLRTQDIGELTVTVIAASVLLSFVSIAYLLGSKAFKKISHDFLLLILMLVFFGVFVDMLRFTVEMGPKINAARGMIEDAGEMFVASFICWYVFLLSIRDKNEDKYLVDFLKLPFSK